MDGQTPTHSQDRDAAEAASVAELFERLARAEIGPSGSELEEAVALFAYALEPQAPRAEARRKLLASLPGKEVSAPAPRAEMAPVISLAEYARRERRANRALFLMAAALVICLVGIGYLYGRLGAQTASQNAELETLSRRMHMVTSVARYAYRMQTVAGAPEQIASEGGKPEGIVYVCGAHQQWILSLEHLAPPPAGYEYHVHFRSAAGEVDGGPLRVGADARAGMEDHKLPPGTRGFSVTLQPVGVPGDPLLVLQSEPGVEL